MKPFWLIGLDVDIPTWLVIILGLLVTYYVYMTWHFGAFKKMGIPGPKPLPLLGTLLDFFRHGWILDQMNLAKYGGVVGYFNGRTPEIMINDPEIIKHVLVKDFDHFVDRRVVDIAAKPFEKSLTQLRGDAWRNVRTTLSPTFSSGKLKRMSVHINACAEQLIDNLAELSKENKPVDFLQYSAAFTMDVIARTAFGYELNTQKEKDNKFVQNATKAMSVGLRNPLFFVLMFFPFALKFVGNLGLVRSMSKDITAFFAGFVEQAIEERKASGKKTEADFLQLIINAHEDQSDDEEDEGYKNNESKQTKKKLTNDEVLANALLFFLAGYETTGNTLAFVGYCLAKNQDCQEKVCQEVDEILGGKHPSYEDLHKLPYLEQVINEAMRIYPQAPIVQRHCQKDITIKNVHFPAGFSVRIPILALHHDPKLWEDPEKFDPDRFTAEEKAKRDQFVYLPFGLGPRMCIANRLALMELKIAIARIVQAGYKFDVCSETPEVMKLQKLRMKPVDGKLMLKIKKR